MLRVSRRLLLNRNTIKLRRRLYSIKYIPFQFSADTAAKRFNDDLNRFKSTEIHGTVITNGTVTSLYLPFYKASLICNLDYQGRVGVIGTKTIKTKNGFTIVESGNYSLYDTIENVQYTDKDNKLIYAGCMIPQHIINDMFQYVIINISQYVNYNILDKLIELEDKLNTAVECFSLPTKDVENMLKGKTREYYTEIVKKHIKSKVDYSSIDIPRINSTSIILTADPVLIPIYVHHDKDGNPTFMHALTKDNVSVHGYKKLSVSKTALVTFALTTGAAAMFPLTSIGVIASFGLRVVSIAGATLLSTYLAKHGQKANNTYENGKIKLLMGKLPPNNNDIINDELLKLFSGEYIQFMPNKLLSNDTSEDKNQIEDNSKYVFEDNNASQHNSKGKLTVSKCRSILRIKKGISLTQTLIIEHYTAQINKQSHKNVNILTYAKDYLINHINKSNKPLGE